MSETSNNLLQINQNMGLRTSVSNNPCMIFELIFQNYGAPSAKLLSIPNNDLTVMYELETFSYWFLNVNLWAIYVFRKKRV